MNKHSRKTSPGLLLIAVFVTVSGCQTTWVNLDNSPAEQDALHQAEITCHVAEKLDSMDQANERKNRRMAKSRTNQSKMQIKDDFALETKSIQAAIDACMREQGLKRAD